MASSGRLEAWWGIAKSIGYELRPFTIPSKDDLKNAAKALDINAKQLWAEGRRLAPEILETAKSVNPLRALSVLAWLCGWAIFTWIEFGVVYFILSAMAMVFMNLGEREEGEWSAYSVFNAGCRALLGTLKAEHLEREIMHQDPGGPVLQQHQQEDDFVWVEPPARIHDEDDNDNNSNDGDDDEEEDYDDGGNGVEEIAEDGDDMDVDVGHDAGVVRRTRKVSGKRARRGSEERRERRQALAALVPEEWE